jgi:TrpR-related protein YerC/YecD
MNWSETRNTRLIEAFLLLDSADQARNFLRDLMTEAEIQEFALRLQTAERLASKVPYSAIEKETGLSSTTIARVAKWLAGPLGGYRQIIDKLHHHNLAKSGRGLD